MRGVGCAGSLAFRSVLCLLNLLTLFRPRVSWIGRRVAISGSTYVPTDIPVTIQEWRRQSRVRALLLPAQDPASPYYDYVLIQETVDAIRKLVRSTRATVDVSEWTLTELFVVLISDVNARAM